MAGTGSTNDRMDGPGAAERPAVSQDDVRRVSAALGEFERLTQEVDRAISVADARVAAMASAADMVGRVFDQVVRLVSPALLSKANGAPAAETSRGVRRIAADHVSQLLASAPEDRATSIASMIQALLGERR
ncbi:MAG: hypothetical protein IPM64_17230 [Phycisphaerales bacterium]|nr:hypothetical protein [Phycisphaerales bacterium]